MATTIDRFVCAVRASVLATVTVLVSLTLHVVAGGHSPTLSSVTLLVGFTALGAYCLSGKQLTFGRAALLLGVAQAGFHVYFDLAAQHPTDGASHASEALAPLSPAMVAAHALATAISALAIAHGDRLFSAAWSWLSRLWLFPLALPAPFWAPPVNSITCRNVDLRELSAQTSDTSRRGPPHVFA